MALQFWFGASGSGKSVGVQQEMIHMASMHPECNYFMIVPDQFTMQTQKQMVKMHPDGGILNIDVLSFSRLSHRVFEEVGKDDRLLLDDTGKCLLLRKILQQEQENIPVLAAGLKHPGYIQEIKSIISEFMQYGLKPEDVQALADFSKDRRGLYLKLSDIKIVYEAFIRECEARFLTKEEMLDVLKQRLPLSDVVKRSTFVFDGFTGFTPIQNRVIEALMILAKDVVVTLEMDHRFSPYKMVGEDFLFYLSLQTVANLQKMAQNNKVLLKEDVFLADVPVKRFRFNPEMSHLERNLFRIDAKTYEADCNTIELVKAANHREECAAMCATMFRLIEKEGYRYRDIAVVTGDMNRYEALLRQQFQKYQVPYFMDTTKSMLTNPFVAFIRNALAVVKYGFRYHEIFQFLRTGLTDITPDEIDLLENYVRARGIRGYDLWSKPFLIPHKECMKDEGQLANINIIREKAIHIFDDIWAKAGAEKQTAIEWCKTVYEFCRAQDVQNKLEKYAAFFETQCDLTSAMEYRQIYRLIMDLLDQIAGLLGNDELTLSEFAEIMDAGFAEIRVRTIPQGVDSVLVGDIERTRLKDIKALFFLGVNDGNLPQSGSKGGIISDLEREFLISSGQELAPTPVSKMFMEHLYLYMNLTKPSEYLYLSYAATEDDGSLLRPAYLIGEICRIFPGLNERQEYGGGRILALEDAKARMATMLRDYVSSTMSEKEQKEFFALYSDLKGREETGEWLREITEAAFITYQPTELERKLAEDLYGKIMECSISSLERFAACHYAHFLSHGLKLEPREEYGFESMDMGNVMHELLQSFGKMLEKEQLDWICIDEEQIEDFLEHAIEEVSVSYGGAILTEGAKNRYYKEQLKRIVKRSVKTLQEQLRHGSFIPYAYEKEFRHIYDFNSSGQNKGQLLLKGRIDRIDTCSREDEVFVKVVDYKAGNHKFDINTLYYGVTLQLAVYLGQTVRKLQKEFPDKKIVPAAMLYYRTADPLLSFDTLPNEEDSRKAILKELNNTGAVSARAGIVEALDAGLEGRSLVVPVSKKGNEIALSNSVYDPVVLNSILDYAGEKTISLAEEIIQGKIDITPKIVGNKDACEYCAYKDACGFDGKIPGYERVTEEEITVEEFVRRRQDGCELHT